MQVEREKCIAIRSPANENAAGRATQRKRADRAASNQQRILKNNLVNEPASACSKRHAHAEFMRTGMETRNLKVREIQTAHQKDGSRERHQQGQGNRESSSACRSR